MSRISQQDLDRAKYGALPLSVVDGRIDAILCDYVTCDDCGGYGFDHDRSEDFCNYSAMYEKVDNAKGRILEVLSINEGLGIRCRNNKHLLNIADCPQCKRDKLSERNKLEAAS